MEAKDNSLEDGGQISIFKRSSVQEFVQVSGFSASLLLIGIFGLFSSKMAGFQLDAYTTSNAMNGAEIAQFLILSRARLPIPPRRLS